MDTKALSPHWPVLTGADQLNGKERTKWIVNWSTGQPAFNLEEEEGGRNREREKARGSQWLLQSRAIHHTLNVTPVLSIDHNQVCDLWRYQRPFLPWIIPDWWLLSSETSSTRREREEEDGGWRRRKRTGRATLGALCHKTYCLPLSLSWRKQTLLMKEEMHLDGKKWKCGRDLC